MLNGGVTPKTAIWGKPIPRIPSNLIFEDLNVYVLKYIKGHTFQPQRLGQVREWTQQKSGQQHRPQQHSRYRWTGILTCCRIHSGFRTRYRWACMCWTWCCHNGCEFLNSRYMVSFLHVFKLTASKFPDWACLGWNPQVAGSSVEDNIECLAGGSKLNGSVVLSLQIKKERKINVEEYNIITSR